MQLQETVSLLSEQKAGVPKSEEHKQAIAIAQRKRHITSSILEAVERVHSWEPPPPVYTPAGSPRSVTNPCIISLFRPERTCVVCCLWHKPCSLQKLIEVEGFGGTFNIAMS